MPITLTKVPDEFISAAHDRNLVPLVGAGRPSGASGVMTSVA